MNILLVNDDGIKSEKLEITKRILQEFGNVTTIAPTLEQSAKSMSLTFGGATYQKLNENTYSVDGTPVDCMNFALLTLDTKPDVVVSGTNNGYNIGIDIRYSGTLGAAFQAQYGKLPSIAFSSDYYGAEMIKSELKKVFRYVLDNNLLSPNHTINVNFPRDSFKDSNGILHTKVYNLMHKFEPVLLDDKYIPNRKYEWTDEVPKDSEQFAYLNGYTSISYIKL